MNWKTLKNQIEEQTSLALINEGTYHSPFMRVMIFFFSGTEETLEKLEEAFPNQIGFELLFEKAKYTNNRALICKLNEEQERGDCVYKYEASGNTLTEMYKAVREKLFEIMRENHAGKSLKAY